MTETVVREAEVISDPAAHAASMVGHHYRVSDFYEIGGRRFASTPARYSTIIPLITTRKAAKGLGYDGLIAPPTFVSIVGMLAQRKLSKRS